MLDSTNPSGNIPLRYEEIKAKLDKIAKAFEARGLPEVADTCDSITRLLKPKKKPKCRLPSDEAVASSLQDFEAELLKTLDELRPEHEHDTLKLVLKMLENEKRMLVHLLKAKRSSKISALSTRFDRATKIVARLRPEHEHDTFVERMLDEDRAYLDKLEKRKPDSVLEKISRQAKDDIQRL